MSTTLRIALCIVSILFLFFIIKAIKSRKLQLSYSIFWIFISGVMIISVAFPNIIRQLSIWLGFGLTSNMVFFTSILAAFYLIFNLTIKVSKDNSKIRELIQEISILNKKIEKLEDNKEKESDDKE